MKKFYLFTLSTLVSVGVLFAQKQENRYAEITNPKLVSINKLPARSSFFSFRGADEAEKAANSQKGSDFLLLNGTWKFNYVENFSQRPMDDFYKPDFDASGWSNITVPGNWELQGFGAPIYVNATYEFCSPNHPPYWNKPNPPYVPEEFNPTGTYRKEFDIPADWIGKKEIILSADATKGAAYYYFNGEFLGLSKDGKLPARFDLTSKARAGRNVLAVQIHRFSDANYLECQDFWRISGFERDVYVYARPKTHVTDFFAQAELDETYTHGRFGLDVSVESSDIYSLTYTLKDAQGKTIASDTQTAKTEKALRFAKEIPNVKKWSAEEPNLYTLSIELKDKNKKVFPLSVKMIIFSYHALNNYVFNGFRRNTVVSY